MILPMWKSSKSKSGGHSIAKRT